MGCVLQASMVYRVLSGGRAGRGKVRGCANRSQVGLACGPEKPVRSAPWGGSW